MKFDNLFGCKKKYINIINNDLAASTSNYIKAICAGKILNISPLVFDKSLIAHGINAGSVFRCSLVVDGNFNSIDLEVIIDSINDKLEIKIELITEICDPYNIYLKLYREE